MAWECLPNHIMFKQHKLVAWSGWYYLLNLFLLWLIASQYLAIIINGYGDHSAPTSLNELNAQYPSFFVWLIFIFFAYTGYIAAFLIVPALMTLSMIALRITNWLVVLITIFLVAILTLYLIADTCIYSMYHYHINGVILRMILSGDVIGIFDFSMLEWLVFISGSAFMLAFQGILAWFAWRWAKYGNSKKYVTWVAAIAFLFIVLSLQLFFYASGHLFFAKVSTTLLMACTVLVLMYLWFKGIVKPSKQFKLLLTALPLMVLLTTFIATTYLANYTPLKVIIFLIGLLIIVLLGIALLVTRHYIIPITALVFSSAMLMYQMFVMEYVPTLRQIVEASYLFPLYDSFAATILSYSKHGKSFYKLNNGYFMQPKGVTAALHYPLQPLRYDNPPLPYNILLIVIDTWRFDAMNQTVTPNIYQFAQSAWQYQNHWSGGNATQSGMFSLFYGLPSNYWSAMLNRRGPLLIKSMLEKKYQVNVFSSSELAIPALYKTIFLDVPNLKIMADGDYIYVRDENVNQQFFASLQQNQQPFFSVLFYDGAHGYCAYGNPVHKFQPETTHCGRLLLNNDSNPIFLKNRYLNALYKIDGLVGEVLNQLKAQNLLDKTIVIITGDHGEEFNDNHLNYWAHASNYTKYQVQTPFIIHWPNVSPKIITEKTSHFDVAPTLLKNVLGCTNPIADYAIGRNLMTNESAKSYLIVGSYNSYGIIEDDRITQLLPDGNFVIYDHHFKPMPEARLRTPVIRMAMQDMLKFYSK